MKKWKRFCVAFLATAAGAGFSPRAPGTAGTILGVILVILTRSWGFAALLAFWTLLLFAGWWATLEWSKESREPDSQKIVIDEVLGYFLAMGFLPRENSILFIQFIIFRILDATKPPPIRQLDRWGKRFPIGPLQSLGVILDDLLAGLLSLLLYFVFFRVLFPGIFD